MNRLESASGAEARVEYLDGDFRVLRPGSFVRCAVTGYPIPLEELHYWDVDTQEPYSSAAARLKALGFSFESTPAAETAAPAAK